MAKRHTVNLENLGGVPLTGILVTVQVDTVSYNTITLDATVGSVEKVSFGHYKFTVPTIPIGGTAVAGFTLADDDEDVIVTVEDIAMDQVDSDSSGDILSGTYTPAPTP